MWGNSYNCSEGVKLFDAVSQADVTILNNGSLTYANHLKSSISAIDITMSSFRLSSGIVWEVTDDT